LGRSRAARCGGITPVRALIMAGYNGGGANAWTGTNGIITSTGANVNGRTVLLGYAQGDDANLNTGAGATHTLGGVAYSGTAGTALVKFTYQGDADLDGDVDGND